MIKLCLLVFTFLVYNANANFEKGFIVLNSGDTLRGEVNIKDRSYTPSKIEYRQTSKSKKKVYEITECSAFGINNGINYKRIRTSFYRTREYDYNPKLVFVSDTVVFMEVVREQKYSLYEFIEMSERPRYFVGHEGHSVKQLIYYSVYKETQFIHNRDYLKTLAEISGNSNILQLPYKRSDLETFIDNLNGVTSLNKLQKEPNIVLNSVLGVVNYNPLVMKRFSNNSEIARFKSNLQPVIGLNLNFPFSKKVNTFSFDLNLLLCPYVGYKESGDSYMSLKKVYTNNVFVGMGLKYMLYTGKATRPFVGFGAGANEAVGSFLIRPNGDKVKLPVHPQNGEFEFNIHPIRGYLKFGLRFSKKLETEVRVDRILKYGLRTDTTSPMLMLGANLNWRLN